MQVLKALSVFAAVVLAMPAQAADFVYSGAVNIPGPIEFWKAVANPIQFNVTGLTTVDDVNITLNGLTHNGSGDLVMALRSPTGTTILVMDSAGGLANWSNAALTFDQSASGTISFFSAPYGGNSGIIPAGSYKPSVHGLGGNLLGFVLGGTDLSTFNGEDANGIWNLYVGDAGILGRGSITGATLSIASASAAVPEPASWAMMIAGFGLLGTAMRRRALPAVRALAA